MKFLDLNQSPITFDGESVACLFIHGFTGTPKEFQELGQFLSGHGLHIRIPLLPGHGTTPAELARTKWTDWTDCVRQEYLNLKRSFAEVFVGGQSMGGTLALHLGSHQPVTGIISLAAPIEYYRPMSRFIPFVKRFYHYYPKSDGNDVRDLTAKDQLPTYMVYPLPSILEFQALVRHTFDDLPEITAPTLVIHSRQDHTIPSANSDKIMSRISAEKKKLLLLDQSYHLLSIDVEKEVIQQQTLQFILQHSAQL